MSRGGKARRGWSRTQADRKLKKKSWNLEDQVTSQTGLFCPKCSPRFAQFVPLSFLNFTPSHLCACVITSLLCCIGEKVKN